MNVNDIVKVTLNYSGALILNRHIYESLCWLNMEDMGEYEKRKFKEGDSYEGSLYAISKILGLGGFDNFEIVKPYKEEM